MADYILKYRNGEREYEWPIDEAKSDSAAIRAADKFLRERQKDNVREMPFAPILVTGTVVKVNEIANIDGKKFLKSIKRKVVAKPWKCHNTVEAKKNGVDNRDACGYIGPRSSFAESENGPKCPKCGADDCTFPHRLFKCKACGKIADQDAWFPEFGLDMHPLREKAESDPCQACIKKYEQEEIPEHGASEQEWEDYQETCRVLQHTPATLEEVPVEFPK